MHRFITFEGIEGSGKTTQIQLLSNTLEERGVEHVLTREPGGTAIGDQIRKVVLNPDNAGMTSTTELMLYAAARAQHIDQVIRPAIEAGRMVLCDRFVDATRAYQGHGRGLPLDLIEELHALEVLALVPDRTILFDLDPARALDRARARDAHRRSDENRFEQEDLAFHVRVREGYRELARREPKRIVVVDADGPIEVVQERVLKAMGPLP